MLHFFFLKYSKKIFQLFLNLIFLTYILFNKRVSELLKIKENFKNLNIKGQKIRKIKE